MSRRVPQVYTNLQRKEVVGNLRKDLLKDGYLYEPAQNFPACYRPDAVVLLAQRHEVRTGEELGKLSGKTTGSTLVGEEPKCIHASALSHVRAAEYCFFEVRRGQL
jgi:hypothetical protein